MAMAIKQEIETKIKIHDIDDLRKKIILAGGIFLSKEKESDEHFDFSDFRLEKEQKVLRIRNKNIVTFKQGKKEHNGKKIANETEFKISDYDAFTLLLFNLGMQPGYYKEKIRETFKLHGCSVTIDILPFGNYLEIEGDEHNINAIAEQLGFKTDQFISDSYPRLHKKYCLENNLPYNKDIRFNDKKTDH